MVQEEFLKVCNLRTESTIFDLILKQYSHMSTLSLVTDIRTNIYSV